MATALRWQIGGDVPAAVVATATVAHEHLLLFPVLDVLLDPRLGLRVDAGHAGRAQPRVRRAGLRRCLGRGRRSKRRHQLHLLLLLLGLEELVQHGQVQLGWLSTASGRSIRVLSHWVGNRCRLREPLRLWLSPNSGVGKAISTTWQDPCSIVAGCLINDPSRWSH